MPYLDLTNEIVNKLPFDLHKLLFSENIFIIENLTNLEKLVGVKEFEIFAIPLKVRADSSIARVIAKI
jgi:kynurenine formamidase